MVQGKIEIKIMEQLKSDEYKKYTIRKLSKIINKENSYSFILKKCNQLYKDGIIKMDKTIININGKDMLVKMVSYK